MESKFNVFRSGQKIFLPDLAILHFDYATYLFEQKSQFEMVKIEIKLGTLMEKSFYLATNEQLVGKEDPFGNKQHCCWERPTEEVECVGRSSFNRYGNKFGKVTHQVAQSPMGCNAPTTNDII